MGIPFAALKEWAQWWVDVGPRSVCCQFADDETLRDADAFDCRRCEFRQRREALSPENARAWTVWTQVASRFAVEFGIGGLWIERATAGWPDEDVADLLARLAVLYDTLHPPRRE